MTVFVCVSAAPHLVYPAQHAALKVCSKPMEVDCQQTDVSTSSTCRATPLTWSMLPSMRPSATMSAAMPSAASALTPSSRPSWSVAMLPYSRDAAARLCWGCTAGSKARKASG